ncbi:MULTISPECIES: FecCD family ABC transporter permease [unclassified Campylobacter]|uniref:FecCD family ABC transporter permease n=1 Tax=unclassified Campylobacter TaxID=2593542 RepID=UPI0022E9A88F|nr:MULTISPECIES: iron ABC transporter permease [unclassified Campylobacter]MDA3055177.1 iron ABC transporter permease [Campylobacter sp. VBCF_07 NA4]MDA3061429.1 iron ABC transporter permease [Campylobacter sp. VBCF_02 NA5]MDA3070946.1 iron ABC transporter permease [Campylobacter sp. VBCF_08 NA3]WBR54086.1 iron ABC transporter permease [Campylobacter sp. VBCF_01 NA2]
MRIFLIILWAFLAIFSLGIGQYSLGIGEILKILLGRGDSVASSVIFTIRIPRILLASLCGGTLALAGLCLQSVFKNPLVGPNIIGISTASALGGALAILFGFASTLLPLCAFIFGVIALLCLFFLAKFVRKTDIFSLILAGIVINGLFSALISLTQYVADDENILPNIIYWLLGSFASANYDKLVLCAAVSIPCIIILILMRFRFNLLSLGDADLKALGVNVAALRIGILVLCTLLISAQVSVSGNIGWIGLVIPHIARIVCGSDNIRSLPACFILGAIFMLIIDDASRGIFPAEIPISILSALIGSPIFAILLKRSVGGKSS